MKQLRYRVFQACTTSYCQRGEAVATIRTMTWESAWNYYWYLSHMGFTAWVEPA